MTQPSKPNEINIKPKNRKKVLNAKKGQFQDFLYLNFVEEMMIVSILAIKNQLLVTRLIYSVPQRISTAWHIIDDGKSIIRRIVDFYSANYGF